MAKDMSKKMDLPPLPAFDTELEKKVKSTEKKGFLGLFKKKDKKPKPQKEPKGLESKAHSIEDQLHNSDLKRKAEVKEKKEPPKDPEKPQEPKLTFHGIDHAHSRQQNYLDGLRRRLDQEMRERRQHLDVQKTKIKTKEEELNKWEKALLQKEKKIVIAQGNPKKLAKLQKELEDKQVTLKYEHMRLVDAQRQLHEKDKHLKHLERDLEKRESQLQEREEKIKVLEHLLLQEGEHKESEEFFTEHQKKLEYKYAKKLKSLHLKEVKHEKKKKSMPSLHIKDEEREMAQIQALIIGAYHEIGHNNLETARVKYVAVREMYQKFVQEYGSSHQLYDEIISLYNDIVEAVNQN